MGSLELKAFGHLLALASVIIVGCGKSCVPVAVRDVRTAKLPFAVLDTEQQTLFKTYRPAVNPDRAWDDLTLPQQIEFGGGTRVVAFGCRLVGCVQSVKEIHGDEPSQPSEDQFNVEVLWDPKALSQKDLPGWSKHIALLHKGQFGYQENRDHNPFLGLVVLFDKQHPVEVIHGQFHIGFRSWFAHYNLVNGNIGDRFNYACYQRWYSKFDDLQPSSEMGSAGVAAVTSLRENKAVRAPLEDAIQDFLESWYVKRDYSRFQSYIATENGFRAQIKSDKLSISQDQLEGGVFASAFAGRAAGVGEIGGLAEKAHATIATRVLCSVCLGPTNCPQAACFPRRHLKIRQRSSSTT